MLHLLAEKVARKIHGSSVETEYEPDFNDAPKELSEKLKRIYDLGALSIFGTVY
jgi:hypothetical protein